MGNTLKFCRNQMFFAPVCTVYGISLRRGSRASGRASEKYSASFRIKTRTLHKN
jgi:hypothetical protein